MKRNAHLDDAANEIESLTRTRDALSKQNAQLSKAWKANRKLHARAKEHVRQTRSASTGASTATDATTEPAGFATPDYRSVAGAMAVKMDVLERECRRLESQNRELSLLVAACDELQAQKIAARKKTQLARRAADRADARKRKADVRERRRLQALSPHEAQLDVVPRAVLGKRTMWILFGAAPASLLGLAIATRLMIALLAAGVYVFSLALGASWSLATLPQRGRITLAIVALWWVAWLGAGWSIIKQAVVSP